MNMTIADHLAEAYAHQRRLLVTGQPKMCPHNLHTCTEFFPQAVGVSSNQYQLKYMILYIELTKVHTGHIDHKLDQSSFHSNQNTL